MEYGVWSDASLYHSTGLAPAKHIVHAVIFGELESYLNNLSLDNEHVYYANGYLVHNEKGSGELDDTLNDDYGDDFANINLGDGSHLHY